MVPNSEKKPEGRAEAPESFHGDDSKISQKCFGHNVYYTPAWYNTRSQVKPYGKDVEEKLRKLITGAFDNPEHDSLDKVCQQIADGAKDALGFVEH